MLFKGGNVFCEDGNFRRREIRIADGIIADIFPYGEQSEEDDDIYDAEGLYIIPGMVDIHTHGCVRCDFSNGSEEELHKIAAFQKSMGVTSFCPASMTLPYKQLEKAFAVVASFESGPEEARVLGINMEGPYISPKKAGAQNPLYVKNPDLEEYERLWEAAEGKISLVTIAPELPGASEFIDRYSKDVCISVGHTMAGYDETIEAFRNGAKHVTHLCNAMPEAGHREPSVFGAAADSKEVFVEVICDGIHIHPSMFRMIYDIFGDDRIVLISDSCEACGMPDGNYRLGGQEVVKTGNAARLRGGVIAGSATHLADCFRKALMYGIPVEAAVKMVTVNPARSIGREGECGVIAVGRRAELVLLDSKFELIKVI